MPDKTRILILGGTGDARMLAEGLVAAGHEVITSLAGVTEHPVLPPGEIRQGGFGGASGLRTYLQSAGIALVIDATHPFAARMSAHAADACRSLNLPLLRFERPQWQPRAGDRWTFVASTEDAARALPSGARVLLTIGRQEVAPFFARPDLSGVARMIEAPPAEPPEKWTILRQRPPFETGAEMALMALTGITHLVTKNSGGSSTQGKLEAARKLSLPVVMIERPVKPPVLSFRTDEDLFTAVERALSP